MYILYVYLQYILYFYIYFIYMYMLCIYYILFLRYNEKSVDLKHVSSLAHFIQENTP